MLGKEMISILSMLLSMTISPVLHPVGAEDVNLRHEGHVVKKYILLKGGLSKYFFRFFKKISVTFLQYNIHFALYILNDIVKL